MPELANEKIWAPYRDGAGGGGTGAGGGRAAAEDYAELGALSNFSFLQGGSHPEEMVEQAARLGYRALAIADTNSLAGVVRAHVAAKGAGMKLVIGARLELAEGFAVLVWASDRAAYGRLCRLVTRGKTRGGKGNDEIRMTNDESNPNGRMPPLPAWDSRERREFGLSVEEVVEMGEGLWAAAVVEDWEAEWAVQAVRRLREGLGERVSLAAWCDYGGDDRGRLERMVDLGRALQVPLLATNRACYHDPARRRLQDVLTCIRHGCTIQEAGYRLRANSERYLKSPAQMHRLLAACPQALRRGVEVAERCTFNLDELRYEYPSEIVPAGKTPREYLGELAWAGARKRYGGEVPEKVRGLLERELKLIGELHFEAYFLSVYDVVGFARSQGILCQGRGSAANSAVCYCLGITAVDPTRIEVLFERFISAARGEPPDIDVDFAHERREEVIQYIYAKYGRERAGMTAEVITYRGRSAVRDVGKALGLSLDVVDMLAKRLDWWESGTLAAEKVRELGLDPEDRTVQLVLELSGELLGFPRHLSQHVGGMVMTQGALCEMVPIENAAMEGRTIIEWDKDDIDALGILKVDVLGLGMLTCIAKCLQLVNGMGFSPRTDAVHRLHRWTQITNSPPSARVCEPRRPVAPNSSPLPLELHSIPAEDPAVYAMIQRADTVGVFQIESRAQMAMLPRLRPERFYDLVIEVAIVRPGPIQGNMVHPYLRRRTGVEAVTYASEALRAVLSKTLGVPLFQEQAMRLAMVAAGFSAEEADRLRRAMAAWKRHGGIEPFHEQIVTGMLRNGYSREYAEQCFGQLRGFGAYGFPESHAASFALLVYVSAWLKRHHPAAFATALLNSQPMGFYAPAQIVRDAQEHGVTVRAVDVNASEWDCTLESVPCPGSRVQTGACFHHGDTETRRESPPLRRGNHQDAKAPSLPPPHGSASPPNCADPWHPAPSGNWKLETGNSLGPALRLGLRMLKGLRQAEAERLVAARERGGVFGSVAELQRAAGLSRATLRLLAEGDACGSLGLTRREALWEVLRLREEEGELFEGLGVRGQGPEEEEGPGVRGQGPAIEEAEVRLPRMGLREEVLTDYAMAGMSLKRHPVGLVREELQGEGIISAAELRAAPAGRWVKVAGLVLVRQRPGTAAGIVFVTLEDETGVVNLVVRPEVYERYRAAARGATLLEAEGRMERQGAVLHVLVRRLQDLSPLLLGCAGRSRDFR